jgi:hypothetical protein
MKGYSPWPGVVSDYDYDGRVQNYFNVVSYAIDNFFDLIFENSCFRE